MIFLTILVIFVVLCVPYYLYFYCRKRYLINKIPGPPRYPFIGNGLEFICPLADLWKLLRRLSNDYYPIYKIWMGGWGIVNLRHPDDVEVLLTSTRHIKKSPIYNILHPWFQSGLLTSTGSKWHTRRKILTPAFHYNILCEFAKVFDEEGRRMVREIKETEDVYEYDLTALITKYTLNAICETAMGTSLAEPMKFHNKYRRAIYGMGELVIHRLVRPWLYNNFLFNLSPTGRKHNKALEIIHGFTEKVCRDEFLLPLIISERKQYHEDTGEIYLKKNDDFTISSKSKKRLAMLDLLIAAMKENEIDETGIREEVDTFIFEGHDTTGMSMVFTLLLLAEHKHIQQRVREEIDDVLQKSNGKMDIGEIQQFTYLECCVKESLRLYPSVPFISRYIQEDLNLKKYLIPGGTIANVHIYDVHRDPNFWPSPNIFDPDRFLPEQIVGRHPFSYIPFSAGQRNCIGQKFGLLELKALIGHLLHNFYLEPMNIASNVEIVPDLVLRPSHSVFVRFVPR